MHHLSHATSSLALGAALLLGGAGGATALGLPGGATSLNETHGDWTVVCTATEGAARCAISQTQVNGESRQRVLTVELTAAGDGNAASGVLILPFGLRLDEGIVLAIDEAQPLQSLRFSTCLPAGCLVPLAFDQDAVSALSAGTTLAVRAKANDTNQDVALSISLRGFTSALARITGLMTE